MVTNLTQEKGVRDYLAQNLKEALAFSVLFGNGVCRIYETPNGNFIVTI